QMQRVAIARALANDPDIILADEPTGALDSQTSAQIMELIREIARDKLVVMVTHNPELAKRYADRTVQFQDGRLVYDSNPVEDEAAKTEYTLKRTSMGFLTALKISGKNIATKKWRTALTAFASSIGIIGIALILSLSNGFDIQISKFESDTMTGFPVLISRTTAKVDFDKMKERRNEMLGITRKENKYPAVDVIYPYDPSADSMTHTNVFTPEYLEYVEKIDPEWISGISYIRLVNMNLLRSDGEKATPLAASSIQFSPYPASLKSGGTSYLESSYDLLEGEYPSAPADLVMIVDAYNRLDSSIVKALGLDAEAESIPLERLVGLELRAVPNDLFYRPAGNYFVINGNPSNLMDLYEDPQAIRLKVTGVVRGKDDMKLSVLSPGIAYSDQLSRDFIGNAKDSQVVIAQQAADYNILTGKAFSEGEAEIVMDGTLSGMTSRMPGGSAAKMTKADVLSMLGADGKPYMITLYPMDFTTKENVVAYLETWNDDKELEDSVIYDDLAATFTSLSGGIMDAITIVLIAFAAISLIVSLIMIGIITYISVLERTREIGVLRALGARKKDITRVFNAETFIIGAFSGAMGILIARLLIFPANRILENITELPDIARLNPLHALALAVLSVSLTLLGGLIPSKIAARKDPVEALRTE
ncbi:MAG TPA: sulfate ABC transporter ATP-binding protein, partial [Clostridiales bacterium]|nr:sulfate ABC transporter ATP-binding protein [Clostridiales bacterium]